MQRAPLYGQVLRLRLWEALGLKFTLGFASAQDDGILDSGVICIGEFGHPCQNNGRACPYRGAMEMKSAKIALVAAFVMTALNSASCLGLLLFDVRHLNSETNHAFPKTEEMQSDILNQMQAGLQQMDAVQQEQFIHQYQIAIYGWIVALAWNLLLAALLIFAISRFQKPN